MRKIILTLLFLFPVTVFGQTKDAASLTDVEVRRLERQASTPGAANRDEAFRTLAEYYMANTGKITPQNADFVHNVFQRVLANDPENLELKENMAEAYTAMRRYPQAAALYEQLVRRAPNRPELYYAMAENLIAANMLTGAGEALADLTDKHPSFIPGHLLYATMTEQILGMPEAAEDIINNMVDSNLQNAAAFARRSMYRLDHRNEKGAYEDLQEALERDPKNTDTITAAAYYYVQTRDFEKAHEYLDALPEQARDDDDVSSLRIRLADAENKPEVAIAELKKRLAKRDNFILRIQLFDRLVATKRLDEARAQIDHLKTMKMSMEMIGFFESAIDIVEGDWRAATRKLELSRSIFSMHPETLAFVDRQLALCYGKLGQTDKQIAAFQRAIENTPQQDILPISIAYILALNTAGKTELLEKASDDLIAKIGEKTFMEIPELKAIRAGLGNLKGSDSPLEDADAVINQARNAGDYLWIGNLALRAEKYSEALAAFEKVVELAPENTTGWIARLQTMKLMGRDNDELLAVKAEMEEAVPAAKLPLANAKVHQLLGDAEAAEKAFKEALEKDPENIEILYSISSFYLRTTRPELARPHLEKMLPLVEKAKDIDERVRAQQRAWVERSLAELDALEKKE